MNEEDKKNEEKEFENIKKVRKFIEEDTERKRQRQTEHRLSQAKDLAEGKNVYDIQAGMSDYEIKEREKRFLKSFETFWGLGLYWINHPSRGITQIKDADKREEALKIYMEVYRRTVEVLIEIGEIKHI